MENNLEEIFNLIDNPKKERGSNILLKHAGKWPWFVLSCVVGVLLGYFVYKNLPNTYQVSSRVLVKNEGNNFSSVFSSDNPIMDMGGNTKLENQIGILRSYTLYRKALDNLDWDYSWYQKKLLYNSDLYKNAPFEIEILPMAKNAKNILIEIEKVNDKEYNFKAKGKTHLNGYAQEVDIDQKAKFGEPLVNEFFNFKLNDGSGEEDATYVLVFNDLNTMTAKYLDRTEIFSETENTDLITILLEGENVSRDADFINELNKVFIQFGMDNQYVSSEKSVEFIESQLERIEKSLSNAEENYSNYRKNNQVMDLGQEAQSVFANLQQIEQEQYLIELQIGYYEELQQYLDDSEKINEMVNPSVLGINDPGLSGMLTKLMELYSRREVLLVSVQAKNPSLLVIDKEIKITRDGLEETLKNQLKATRSKLRSNKERYSEIQGRLEKLPETEKKLIGIQRDFELNNELYTFMLQKQAETSITKASIAPEVQLIDKALPEAAKWIGPMLVVYVASGLIIGGLIPLVLIIFLSFFNNKIESKEEVESVSRISVLDGVVKHKYKEKLPVMVHPRSGISECFRGLKSNVNAIVDKPGAMVISINSLIPGEGKSFISSNFSAALSGGNKKVLLIGADLHIPTLHVFLDMKQSIGLSDFLKNEKNFNDIVSATAVSNLHFIQAGTTFDNPSDLLDTDKFKELVEQARKIYDYIVIDNAPLLLVPDAILTSRLSDISLFVVRVGYSHKDQIKQINKVVDFNRIKHSAIVVNGTPDRGYGYGKKYWEKGYGAYRGKMSIA